MILRAAGEMKDTGYISQCIIWISSVEISGGFLNAFKRIISPCSGCKISLEV
jgi:hypothetical protein